MTTLETIQAATDIYRLLAYMVGVGFAFALAGRLFSIGHTLGRLFGAVMTSWAIVCLAMALLLISAMISGIGSPTWRWILMTFVGTVLWVVPCVLAFRFSRLGESAKQEISDHD